MFNKVVVHHFGLFFVKWVRRRDETPIYDPWACLLVAPGPLLEAPGAEKEVMLNTTCVSQSDPTR
jgi:hypothetical protein